MKKDTTHLEKGKLLEEIVAKLHDYEGVEVERNVWLPSLDKSSSRKREIDVLLTTNVAGYPIRIAFQCKNESTKVKLVDIGGFIDALDDVGIPHQHGIFVSVSGYQKGAIERAKEKGVRTLELEGLTSDRLAVEIEKAFQFFVYLAVETGNIEVVNGMPQSDQALVFTDDNQVFCGDVLDLIVSRWRNGEIPEKLGKHELSFAVPQGWYQFWENKPVQTFSIDANVIVTAYIIELVGKAKKFRLLDAETKEQEKFQFEAEFNVEEQMKEISEKIANGFETKFVRTEEELSEILNKSEISVINRIRLPRILAGKCFHPISKRVAEMLSSEVKDKTLDEIDSLPPLSFDEYEGKVIGSIHEMPLRGFPVIIRDEKGDTYDLRLLLKNNEYQKVLNFKSFFNKYPTPEFAELLQIANEEIGKQILGGK